MAGRKALLAIGPAMVTVSVVGAVRDEDDDIETRTVCDGPKDGSAPHAPIRANGSMSCPECGRKESSHWGFKKARENADGSLSVIDERPTVDQHTKDVIDLVFCPKDQLDAETIPYGKTYYLPPATGVGVENYRDFLNAITDAAQPTKRDPHGLAPATVWAYRSAPVIVRLVVMGDLLAMQQVAWPRMVVARPAVTLPESKRDMAPLFKQAVEMLRADFTLDTFVDTRREKLLEALAAAGSTQPGVAAVVTESGPDMMVASLEAFVASKAKKAVGGKGQTATKKAAAKKAATPRKKTA